MGKTESLLEYLKVAWRLPIGVKPQIAISTEIAACKDCGYGEPLDHARTPPVVN